MSWLVEAVRFEGSHGGSSSQYYDVPDTHTFDQLYSWPQKNPVVFLGGNDKGDVEQVKAISGSFPCIRINVAAQEPQFSYNLPPADISFTLPEFPTWDLQTYERTKNEFNKAVQTTVKAIQHSTPECPLYIHCVAGINRSASVLAAALTEISGQPLINILRDMKTRRSIVSPHDAYFMMATDYSPADSPEWKANVQRELDMDKSIGLVACRNWMKKTSARQFKGKGIASITNLRFNDVHRILSGWGYELSRSSGSHRIYTKPDKNTVTITAPHGGQLHIRGTQDALSKAAREHQVSLLDFLQINIPQPESVSSTPQWQKQPWYQEAKPMPFKRTLDYMGQNYQKSRDWLRGIFTMTPERIQDQLHEMKEELAQPQHPNRQEWLQKEIAILERELEKTSSWKYRYKNAWRE
ncbi:hypothetical protein LCGC14_0629800 [marine sediment metagenome]|uniref:Tyrosine specific protein phosphatases domain-containing protein n=1 Tax=marine sediment metagenome TaxID=412755 RepID=A0A0F9R7G6_9ZZZZ